MWQAAEVEISSRGLRCRPRSPVAQAGPSLPQPVVHASHGLPYLCPLNLVEARIRHGRDLALALHCDDMARSLDIYATAAKRANTCLDTGGGMAPTGLNPSSGRRLPRAMRLQFSM